MECPVFSYIIIPLTTNARSIFPFFLRSRILSALVAGIATGILGIVGYKGFIIFVVFQLAVCFDVFYFIRTM